MRRSCGPTDGARPRAAHRAPAPRRRCRGRPAPATLREFKEVVRARVPRRETARVRLEHLEDRRRHRHAAQQSLQEARAVQHQAGDGRLDVGLTGCRCDRGSAAAGQTTAVVADSRARKSAGERRRRRRKVRTPEGSAPGNARSGQLEGQWHRKYTASPSLRRSRRARGDGEVRVKRCGKSAPRRL